MSIKTMQASPFSILGYADLIAKTERVRRKNTFIKFLLVFPAAFIAYTIHGGVGPFLQEWFTKLDVIIPILQIALFIHFIGSGNLLKGFDKCLAVFNEERWKVNHVLRYIPNNVGENWLPLFVNLMIFMGMMIGIQIGLSIVANITLVQRFLENWNILYPNAGAAPIFQFFKYYILSPIALSFAAVTINWLFLDKLNQTNA